MKFNPDLIVEWCPICSQGWIEIAKEKETGQLFCYCNECESEWTEPCDVELEVLTINRFGEVTEPTVDEIVQRVWGKYTKKCIRISPTCECNSSMWFFLCAQHGRYL